MDASKEFCLPVLLFIFRCFIATPLLWINLASAGVNDISEAYSAIDIKAARPATNFLSVQKRTYAPQGAVYVGRIYATGMATIDPEELHETAARMLLLEDRKPPTIKDDIRLAESAMYSEAAKIGANIVIIRKSEQVRVTNDATERRIVADAFFEDRTPPQSFTPQVQPPAPKKPPQQIITGKPCSESSECGPGQFCYQRKCDLPSNYADLPQRNPVSQGGSGARCMGDENCSQGLLCKNKYFVCTPDNVENTQ